MCPNLNTLRYIVTTTVEKVENFGLVAYLDVQKRKILYKSRLREVFILNSKGLRRSPNGPHVPSSKSMWGTVSRSEPSG